MAPANRLQVREGMIPHMRQSLFEFDRCLGHLQVQLEKANQRMWGLEQQVKMLTERLEIEQSAKPARKRIRKSSDMQKQDLEADADADCAR